jgi:hypothetical protein
MGASVTVAAVNCVAREDGRNGRIREYKIYLSSDLANWGEPATSGKFNGEGGPHLATLAKPVSARYLRVVAVSGFGREPFASLAELTVVPAASK